MPKIHARIHADTTGDSTADAKAVVLPFRRAMGGRACRKDDGARRDVPATAWVAPPAAVPNDALVTVYPVVSSWPAAGFAVLSDFLGRTLEEKPFSLYVHLPFCVRRCRNCDYLADEASHCGRVDEYLDAVLQELRFYARSARFAGRPLDCLYLGGGMPPVLSLSFVQALLKEACGAFSGTPREVVYECTPRGVTLGRMRRLLDLGVTRVQLLAELFDDEVLARSGHHHRKADVERAYAAIRRLDFPVVNVTLRTGLPGEADASLEASVAYLAELEPDSFILRRSEPRFGPDVQRRVEAAARDGDLAILAREVGRSRLQRAYEFLTWAGYEVLPSGEAVRNTAHSLRYLAAQNCWGVLGVGVAALSVLDGVQLKNVSQVSDYVDRVSAGVLPISRAYRLDAGEEILRRSLHTLRCGRVERRHPFNGGALTDLVERGWLAADGDGWTVTREGLVQSERIASALCG